MIAAGSRLEPYEILAPPGTTGRLELWKELSVPDLGAGALGVPDPGWEVVYGYTRYFSDLFIVEGLR